MSHDLRLDGHCAEPPAESFLVWGVANLKMLDGENAATLDCFLYQVRLALTKSLFAG